MKTSSQHLNPPKWWVNFRKHLKKPLIKSSLLRDQLLIARRGPPSAQIKHVGNSQLTAIPGPITPAKTSSDRKLCSSGRDRRELTETTWGFSHKVSHAMRLLQPRHDARGPVETSPAAGWVSRLKRGLCEQVVVREVIKDPTSRTYVLLSETRGSSLCSEDCGHCFHYQRLRPQALLIT